MSEKVALLDAINPAARQTFEEGGFEVVEFDKSVTAGEFAVLTSDVRVLGVRSGP